MTLSLDVFKEAINDKTRGVEERGRDNGEERKKKGVENGKSEKNCRNGN